MGTVDTVFSVVLDYEDNGYSGHRSLALCGQWTPRRSDEVMPKTIDYLDKWNVIIVITICGNTVVRELYHFISSTPFPSSLIILKRVESNSLVFKQRNRLLL